MRVLLLLLSLSPASAQGTDERWEADVAEASGRIRALVEAPAVQLRFPTVEVFALRNPRILAGPGYPLTPSQIEDARRIFGEAVDYGAVRLVWTELSLGEQSASAWGNVIRVKSGSRFRRRDLIHELAHVWQFQTSGADYISDSLSHQLGGLFRSGDRNAAYRYELREGDSIFAFPSEQQAELLEDIFADELELRLPEGTEKDEKRRRTQAEAARLLEQVQRTRPSYDTDSAIERAASLPPRRQVLPAPHPALSPLPGGDAQPWVPQLELRFRGL